MVPAKLASSTFLQDLSTVSGADLVGQPATASSLGLADSYTLSVLTSCAHFSDGSVSCAPPRIPFSFDPATDLKIESTSLQGSYSQNYLDALSKYVKASAFMAGAYIASGPPIILASITAKFSRPSRGAAVATVALSVLATIFLLGASITALITFTSLNSALNAEFKDLGLTSALGPYAFIFSCLSAAFSLAASIVWIIRACSSLRSGTLMAGTIGPEDNGHGKKPGLMGRIPTRATHRYVQIEKQTVLVRTSAAARHQDGVIIDPQEAGRLNDDWNGVDEYSSGDGGRGIAMASLSGNKKTKDVDAVYEPYATQVPAP
jgi:hypothetical protein